VGWGSFNETTRATGYARSSHAGTGRAHGIPTEVLFHAARNGAGTHTYSDDISVRFGMYLWRKYGSGLTRTALVTELIKWAAPQYRHLRSSNTIKSGFCPNLQKACAK
jgi:hypothetical protein